MCVFLSVIDLLWKCVIYILISTSYFHLHFHENHQRFKNLCDPSSYRWSLYFFQERKCKKKNAYKRRKTETQKRLEGMRSCKSIWVDMSVWSAMPPSVQHKETLRGFRNRLLMMTYKYTLTPLTQICKNNCNRNKYPEQKSTYTQKCNRETKMGRSCICTTAVFVHVLGSFTAVQTILLWHMNFMTTGQKWKRNPVWW